MRAASVTTVKLSSGGFIRLDARSLVLLEPSKRKAAHPISDVVFLRLAALPPFASCR